MKVIISLATRSILFWAYNYKPMQYIIINKLVLILELINKLFRKKESHPREASLGRPSNHNSFDMLIIFSY